MLLVLRNSLFYLFLATNFIFFATVADKSDEGERVPLIFDNDANYDDVLGLMYLVNNPLFDLKAITTAGSGFATHHGGPINMQQVLQLYGKAKVPVSYGEPISLSPLSSFPLQWRIELDEFFQKQNLPEADMPLSVYQSHQLIAKILRESPVAVAIAVTGPATNLALALQKEPELIDRISGIFLMGSNYGGGPNNVYDWQMTFGGIQGACAEDASFDNFSPNVKPLNWELKDGTTEKVSIRPGCRGNDMSKTGNTEWNVFLDAVAWHTVTRMAAEASTPPKMYVITSGSSEDMPITMDDFKKGLIGLKDENLANFTLALAGSFLNAGEAKWWDAQLVVAMAGIITDIDENQSVCSMWRSTTGFKVHLDWKRISSHDAEKGVMNPYGSVTDVDGIGPKASFCLQGNVTNMQNTFWETVKGNPGSTIVYDPSIYLRMLPKETVLPTSSEKYSYRAMIMTNSMVVSLIAFFSFDWSSYQIKDH